MKSRLLNSLHVFLFVNTPIVVPLYIALPVPWGSIPSNDRLAIEIGGIIARVIADPTITASFIPFRNINTVPVTVSVYFGYSRQKSNVLFRIIEGTQNATIRI